MTFHRKQKYFTIIYILILVLLSLLAAEIGMRFYHAGKQERRYVYIPDFYLGYTLASNNQFIWRGLDDHPEFKTTQRTNALGLMGKEVARKKSPGTYRIVVLGDSYTEAVQVEEEQKYCALLEKELNRLYGRVDRHFEVLNAGVRGYSPIVHYMKYKRVVAALDPDFVILQLFANDVSEDNHVRAESLVDANDMPIKLNHYFKTSKDSLIPEWMLKIDTKLTNFSRLYEYMHVQPMKMGKRSKYNVKMRSMPEFSDAYQFYIVQSHPEEATFGEKDFRQKRWMLTKKYITALKDLVAKDHHGFVMFNVPVETQLNLKEYGEQTRVFFFGGVTSYFDDRLRELSHEQDFDYIDMKPVFQRHADEGLYFHWDGHLTQAGHRALTEGLVEYFNKQFKP